MAEIHDQIDVIKWCLWNRQKYKNLNLIHAHSNEGRRTKVQNGLLKAAGMRKGFPDLELPPPLAPALFIEMKTERGKIRKEQQEWAEKLVLAGHVHHFCRGSYEATEAIEDYYRKYYPEAILL
jgi:hypothetical protein